MTAAHDADESRDAGRKATERAGGTSLYARDWGDAEPEVPDHPEPEVVNRPATEDEMSRSVNTMIRKLGVGWSWTVQYSRGAKPLSRKPWIGPATDVLRLNARHRATGVAAVALWHSGKFHQAMAWTVCRDPRCPRAETEHAEDAPVILSSRELAAVLAESAPDLATHHHTRGLDRLADEVARYQAFLERRRKDR